MKRLEQIFTSTEMTWKRVLILSVILGVIPGVLMIPDFLIGTSFTMPGTTYEFWIFAALFIILNCGKPLEAGLKTFVMFLISQPLIYLVQVPFSWQHWGLFSYYPLWLKLTILTLPGAMVAWYVKKGNILSVLIFSVANAIICLQLANNVMNCINEFPKLILSIIFMGFEITFFISMLFKEKKEKVTAIVLTVILLGLGFAAYYYTYMR